MNVKMLPHNLMLLTKRLLTGTPPQNWTMWNVNKEIL